MKYVAGKWTKCVGAHAQMGLPHLKLAQAMTRVMTTFLSARSQRICCLDHRLHPCIWTLPNSVSDFKVRNSGLGLAYHSPDSQLRPQRFTPSLELPLCLPVYNLCDSKCDAFMHAEVLKQKWGTWHRNWPKGKTLKSRGDGELDKKLTLHR